MKRLLVLFLLFGCSVSLAAQHLSVSILGDSYSTFQGYLEPDTNAVWYWAKPDPKRTDVNSVRQTWWHMFVKENGYKLDVNNSFSGSTICFSGYKKEGSSDFTDYSDRSFVTRLTALGNPDIILVFGATNDSWAGSPIGEYKYQNYTRNDLYSFRPALAFLLENLIDYYPSVKIYFILNDGLKEEINESVLTVCRHFGIDCIVLHDIDKISGHPSVKGMRSIADQVREYMGK